MKHQLKKFHLQLWLPAGSDCYDKPGFLSLNGGVLIVIQPRHWRLIFILYMARAQDRKKRLPKPAAGWRSRPVIAAAIDQLHGYPVSVAAVATYASQLAGELRRASPGHDGRDQPWLEKRARQGYRIAEHVKVTIRFGVGVARN